MTLWRTRRQTGDRLNVILGNMGEGAENPEVYAGAQTSFIGLRLLTAISAVSPLLRSFPRWGVLGYKAGC